MRQEAGNSVTNFNVVELNGNDSPQAMTSNNIANAFEFPYLVPFNRDIFGDDKFYPRALADRSVLWKTALELCFC